MGNAFQELGRLREAGHAYEQVIELLPRAQVFRSMGQALLQLGDLDAAMLQFCRALELDSEMRESYVGLVRAQRQAEQHRGVLGTVQDALRRRPQDEVFWRMAGEAHAALGEEHQAVRVFRRSGAPPPRLQNRLGAEALRRRLFDRATEHYERILELVENAGGAKLAGVGDQVRALNGLGKIAYSRDEFAAVLMHFRRAAQLDHDAGTTYANIGSTYLNMVAYWRPLRHWNGRFSWTLRMLPLAL